MSHFLLTEEELWTWPHHTIEIEAFPVRCNCARCGSMAPEPCPHSIQISYRTSPDQAMRVVTSVWDRYLVKAIPVDLFKHKYTLPMVEVLKLIADYEADQWVQEEREAVSRVRGM